ncbi:unannotated protein [freshwater metagenome]|uniref:Unannotated protein n=1 Tax=freshwater metagenome TaxID=449393 RepID=A0A6J6GPS7_9ZZZZ
MDVCATVSTDSVSCRIGNPYLPCTQRPATHHNCAGAVVTAARPIDFSASAGVTSRVPQIMKGTRRAGPRRTKTTELALVPAMRVTTMPIIAGARQVRSLRASAVSPMSQGSAAQGRRMTEVRPK